MFSALTVGTGIAGIGDIITALSLGFEGLASSIGISTTALGGFIAIAAGLIIIPKIIDAIHISSQESAEALSDMKSEYDSNKSELESLNSELETTQSRMDELQAKGHLTLTEQEELENLQAQNAELERTIALKEAQQKIDAKKLANQAEETYVKWTTAQDLFNRNLGDTSYSKESVKNYKNNYLETPLGYASQDRIDRIKQNAVKGWWEGKVNEGATLNSLSIKEGADNINYLIGIYEALEEAQKNVALEIDNINSKSKNASDDELEDLTKQSTVLQEYYDQLEEKSLEAQGYMNDYADVISDTYNAYMEAESQGVITDPQKEQLKEMESFMTEYMKITTNTAGNVETKINNLFAKSQFINLKDQLVDAANSGESVLSGVIDKTPGLTDALEDAGIEAKQLSDYIMAIADPDSLKLDVIKEQLRDSFIPDIQDVGAHAKKAKKAIWDEFIGDKSDEEIEIFYRYVNSNDFDISDWNKDDLIFNYQKAIQGAQKVIEARTPITFSSLLSSDAEGNQSALSKEVDEFQSNISTIQESLDSLKAGETVDLTDLTQEFPELVGQTDNLQEALSKLQVNKITDFTNTYKSMLSDITDPQELKAASQFFQNLISSIDLSNVDFSDLRQSLFDNLFSGNEGDRGRNSELIQKLIDEYADTAEGKEVLLKLSIDPDSANWSDNEWKSRIESKLPEIQLRVNKQQVSDLQDNLTELQDEATNLQDALSMKDVRGVQKVANDYDDLLQNSKEQILNLREQNSLLKEQQSALLPTDVEYRNIQSQIDSNNASIRSAIKSQLEWNEAIKSLPQQPMTQLNEYNKAQSSSNASDPYSTIVSGKEGADKLWEQGWVGKDDFTTYAQLLAKNGDTLYDAISNYESNANRLKKYLTEDTSGLYQFLDDAVDKTTELGADWVKLRDDGQYAFDIDNLEEFANQMGINTELAGHFMIALRDMGMNVDLSMIGTDFAKQFEEVDMRSNNAAQQVQNLINEMETLASTDIDITGSVDASASALKELSDQGVDVTAMLEQLNELGNMNGFHINDDFTVTFTSLQSAYDKISKYKNLSVNVNANVNGQEQLDTIIGELSGLDQETLIEIGFTPADGQTITKEDIKNQIGTVEIPIQYQNTSTDGLSNIEEIPVKTSEVDDSTVQEYEAGEKTIETKTGKVDDSTVQSYNPTQKIVPVKTGELDKSSLNVELPTLTQKIEVRRVNTEVQGATQALGTAHANGTVMDMWNDYRHSVGAYADGSFKDWSLPHDENALVNETGAESIVRDGRWFMIPGKAHMQQLKRGDIIFNAVQTEELIKNGRVISGGGHGRVALANGTAYNMMPAHAINSSVKGGIGNSFTKRPIGSSSSSSPTSSSSASTASSTAKSAQDTAKAAEDTKESMDWIVIAISSIQRKIQNLKSVAENVYNSFTVRNKNLASEIKSVRKEIDIQTKGAKRYKKEADSVNLSAKLKKRVQNGTIDINKYDEDTQKKIKEYQQWYEKMLSCKDAVSELRDTITELYRQKFDNILTKWSNSVQDLEHQAERTESAISNRTNKASEHITIDNSTSASRMNITDYKSLISNQQSQIVKKQAELAELQSDLDWAVKNSKATGITKGSEGYYDMLAEIQSVEKEIDSLNGEIIDGVNSVAEEYMNIFDNITTDFENKLSLSEHISNVYSNALDLAEEKGFMASTKYYEMLSGIEKDNIGVMEQELESLKQAANEAIASGAVEAGSQSWYDMQQQINEVAESTDEARLKLEQYANAIRQIGWDRFDYLQDKISLITDEANFLIDLMSNSDLFNDKGIVNDDGMATFGLHGQNYNVLMRQADDYAEQIKKIESDIANDPSDTKLIERKEELVRLQHESIKAAEDEKQAIKSLVKEGIDKQLESLKDLIDEYKDALKSQKDLYDYQKNIADQVKNISSLQKQLNVYEGDSSEENQAKVQKLKVEYDEAQSKLEETQYDHFISDQEKLLDDLYDDYEKVLNERLDNIDALIKGVCDAVNANSGTINKTLSNIATDVGYTLSGELQSIWGKDGTIFSVLETYHNGFVGEGGALNAVAATLDSIKISIEKMIVSADKNADEAGKKAEESNIQQQPVQPTQTAQPVVQPNPIGSSTPTAEPAVTDIKNPISQADDKIMKIINSGKKRDKKISDYENKKHSDLWKYLVKSYGRDTSESIMKKLANALGVNASKNITESEKKSVLKALKKKGYASGTSRVDKDEWNWTNEGWLDGNYETIVRKRDGAILTPLNTNDMVYSAFASKNMHDFAQNPRGYVGDLVAGLSMPQDFSNIRSTVNNTGDTTLNLSLEFPNVQNYQQLKYAMQHDPDFEGFVQSITVDRLAGKSKNAKYNYRFR